MLASIDRYLGGRGDQMLLSTALCICVRGVQGTRSRQSIQGAFESAQFRVLRSSRLLAFAFQDLAGGLWRFSGASSSIDWSYRWNSLFSVRARGRDWILAEACVRGSKSSHSLATQDEHGTLHSGDLLSFLWGLVYWFLSLHP